MKIAAIAALLIGASVTAGAHAANRTTVIGEIDPAADSVLLRMLEPSSQPDIDADAASYVVPELIASPVPAAASTEVESWLMTILGVGLVAFQLRRKQKTLHHPPLEEAIYR